MTRRIVCLLVILSTLVVHSFGASNFKFDDSSSENVNTIGSVSSFNFFHQTLNFTISFWARIDDLTQATHGMFVSAINGSTTDRGVMIYFNTGFLSNGYRIFVVKGTSGTTAANRDDASLISDNNWHHFAWTCNGSALKIYVDGVDQGGSGTINGTGTGNATSALMYGSIGAGAYADAALSDVRIYNTALTDAEILTIASGSLDPLTTSVRLMTLLHGEPGASGTVEDISGQDIDGTNNGSDPEEEGPPTFFVGGAF